MSDDLKSTLHVILVANYLPDNQESMNRFAELIASGLTKSNISHSVIRPSATLHRFSFGIGALHKWLGYIDKYLLFPITLRALAKKAEPGTLIHICDHSNAPYCKALASIPHLVTCHDFTAIKSGLGITKTHKTRFTGRILQRYILKGLTQAKAVASVSEKTHHDFKELVPTSNAIAKTIHNGFNNTFEPLAEDAVAPHLTDIDTPYYLHVGGDSWYKNRLGVIALFAALSNDQKSAMLYLVGPPLNEACTALAKQHGLLEKIKTLDTVPHAKLNALYSRAELLLFPSHEEGFGWPLIEAQAAGCPVVTIDKEPMKGIVDDASILLTPCPLEDKEQEAWAQQSAVKIQLALLKRQDLIKAGLENAKRFDSETMLAAYIAFYKECLKA